ncbi:alpha-N-acetylneuraminide alpha-2,8-sialyltransferase-like isoform X1 [Ptychodera flava]|uniref:alpha-N-acetylneuraminide alpha-2,8-sialyltransferase-like isoform X1 n=1 Tax=Ptychodera flava TaxID=63121 RepID=UPI00396A5165
MLRRLRKLWPLLMVLILVALLVLAANHRNVRWSLGLKRPQGFVGRKNYLLVQGPPPEQITAANQARDGNKNTANDVTKTNVETDIRNETEDDVSLDKLNEYVRTVSLPWQQNLTALDNIRKALDANLTALHGSVVTQENTPSGSSLHFSSWPGLAPINEKIHQLFPKKTPFPVKPIKRCSVIGNSGTLIDSNCGDDIDKAEYVFRCNAAPISKFAKDAGRKTNLTTLNKSVLHDRYMTLKSLDSQFEFQNDMREYNGLIWIPAYANRPSLEDCYTAKRIFQSEISQIVFGHPQHFLQVSKYWATRGVKGILTTGFYLLSMALNLCEETHVFGFWPFLKNPDGQPIKFHYYDEIGFVERTKRIHEIPLEFELLYELHQQGILRMHVDRCR